MDLPLDKDVGAWIAEMVLRAQNWRVSGKRILYRMNLPDGNGRFQKLFLLRSIWQEVIDGRVSEEILDEIESLEKLLSSEGCKITDSMKAAYCAVAVECTVRYMVGVEVRRGIYVDVLKRIWVERIGSAKQRKSQLVSDELEKWEGDLNAAMRNKKVCKRVRKSNTRNCALMSLKEFVWEEWALLGPPFLTTVTKMMQEKNKDRRSEEQENEFNQSGVGKEVEENAAKQEKETVVNMENGSMATENNQQGSIEKVRGGGNVVMDAEIVPPVGEQPDRHRDGETGKDKRGSEKCLGFKEVLVDHGKRDQRGESGAEAFRDKQRRIDGSKFGETSVSQIGRGSCLSSGESTRDDTALVKGKEICVERGLMEQNPTVSHEPHAQVIKSADPVNLNAQLVLGQRSAVSCDEGHGVRKLIRELIANRRSDALEEATKELSVETAQDINNKRQRGKSGSHQCATENVEAVQVQGMIPANQCQSRRNDAQRPSLMERNRTAVSYTWEDSIEDASEENSPTRQGQRHNRRRRRMWTYEEVMALSDGLRRFGTDWKAIKDAYPNELARRTTVDLKDKWRNEVGR